MNCRFCGKTRTSPPDFILNNQPLSAQGFSTSALAARETRSIRIFECYGCGLTQHADEPVAYYKDVIRATGVSHELEKFKKEQLSAWVSTKKLANAPILEIGSGAGDFLDILRSVGCTDLYGLEHSHYGFNELKRKGYQCFQGYLDHNFVSPWPHQFQGVVCFNFLEHWPNLKDGLTCLKQLIAPGGHGIIEVPNFSYILQSNLFAEFTTDHIYYFDECSLNMVLSSVGLNVQSIKTIWNDYILCAEVARPSSKDFSKFESHRQSTQKLMELFFKEHAGNLAVWGAGHQALSLLSMVEADRYVDVVIDSAPFKQESLCPGTGIPVFSPTKLTTIRPEKMLVMGGSYSSEIVNTLQTEHRHIKEIFVFKENSIDKVS